MGHLTGHRNHFVLQFQLSRDDLVRAFVNGYFCHLKINGDEYMEELRSSGHIWDSDSTPTSSLFSLENRERFLGVFAVVMKQSFTLKLGSTVGGGGAPHHIWSSIPLPLSLPGSIKAPAETHWQNSCSQYSGLAKRLFLLVVDYNSLEEGENDSVPLPLVSFLSLVYEIKQDWRGALCDSESSPASTILTGRSNADWHSRPPLETTTVSLPALLPV